jgi:hypothetical protein
VPSNGTRWPTSTGATVLLSLSLSLEPYTIISFKRPRREPLLVPMTDTCLTLLSPSCLAKRAAEAAGSPVIKDPTTNSSSAGSVNSKNVQD